MWTAGLHSGTWAAGLAACALIREKNIMKVHYRIIDNDIEIVRCFGTDPEIVVPEEIDGRPVKRMAPYAFSARKDREDEDVLVFETDEERMFSSEEKLLAGQTLESVRLPDTMEEAGRYLFYGCRNLRELHFSDRLKNIGSGAFTGCRSLSALHVRLLDGDRSCVHDILGDLWQRIDVTFYKGGTEARLVFPEHYEEAVENTPARILFTQHHGSGNNYRQCFYNKEIDYRKYDGLFYSARAQDDVNVISDLIFARLMYPEDLTKEAQKAYEDYVREHALPVAEHLTDTEDLAALKEFSARELWTRESLTGVVHYASGQGKRAVLAFLMNEKHRLYPERKKKYEL